VRAPQLGRIGGSAVAVHPSWLVLEALLIGTVLFVEIPARRPLWSDGVDLAVAISVGFVFLLVTIVHEAAHLLVGARLRVPPRDVVVHAFGAPSPIDGGGHPRAELATALAGPAASGLIAAALLTVAAVLEPVAPLPLKALGEVSLVVGLLAAATAAVNLVPVVPLDAARALRALVAGAKGDRTNPVRVVGIVGQAVGWAIAAVGVVLFLQLDPLSGALVVMLGLFLRTAARSSTRQHQLATAIAGMTVRQVMESGLPCLPPATTVDAFAPRLEGPGELTALPVGSPDQVVGVVGLRDLRRVADRERATTRAVQAMTPLADLPAVTPGQDLAGAIAVLASTRSDAIPVVEEGRFVGLLTRYAAGRAIGARAAAREAG
jgi:CBS domain-containing protein